METAILMPLLLLLVMGTVDAGRMLFAYIALEEAVHEGATYAAQVGDLPAATRNTAIRDRVRTSSDHAEVTGATVADATCTTATITVTATYPLPVLTPLASFIFGNTITLVSTVSATNLRQECN